MHNIIVSLGLDFSPSWHCWWFGSPTRCRPLVLGLERWKAGCRQACPVAFGRPRCAPRQGLSSSSLAPRERKREVVPSAFRRRLTPGLLSTLHRTPPRPRFGCPLLSGAASVSPFAKMAALKEARLGRLRTSMLAESFFLSGHTRPPPRRDPPQERGRATPEAPSQTLCQDGGRAAGRRQRPLPRWRRRLPARAAHSAGRCQSRGGRGRVRAACAESGCAARSGQGRGGAAAASAPGRSWQALSPVGAHKLPPETLKPHSTTFPESQKP